MKRPVPIRCLWDGGVLHPQGRSLAACIEQFGDGEIVMLERHEERSEASHGHFFAAMHDAWLNLPEDIADAFPTDNHLRNFALIKAGYCDIRKIICESQAQAATFAAVAKTLDEYVITVVNGSILTIYKAMSQSRKAMTKQQFQDSKTKVLDVVAAMVGVSPHEFKERA